MNVTLQIAGTHTIDGQPAIMLHCASARYLFGCGEGLQRVCNEHRLRLAKLRAIFIAQPKWRCVGGLPGMLLTLADTGISTFNIFGPEAITHMLASTRSFIGRKGIEVHVQNVQDRSASLAAKHSLTLGQNPAQPSSSSSSTSYADIDPMADSFYKDENLSITAVAIYPSSSASQPAENDASTIEPVITHLDLLRTTSATSENSMSSETATDSLKRKATDHHNSMTNADLDNEFVKMVLSRMFPNEPSQTRKSVHESDAPAADVVIDDYVAQNSSVDQPTPSENAAPQKNGRSLYGSVPASESSAEKNGLTWEDFTALGYSWNHLPRIEPSEVAITYICQGPERIGRMDAAIAKKLGVKMGPDLGKLKAGQSVTAEDGSTVHPWQCVEPNKPGPLFLIVDCPSPAYIDSFSTNPKLCTVAAYRDDLAVDCVVHVCGDGVLEDSRYIAWMHSFPKSTNHIYVSKNHNRQPIVFESSAKIQYKLNSLDASMFPLPYVEPNPASLSEKLGLPKKAVPAELLLSYQLQPKAKFDRSECLPPFKLDTDEVEYKNFLEHSAEIIKKLGDLETLRPPVDPATDVSTGVAVTPLGTGSAIPGKYRNVSSTVIETPTGTIILDSGEGTLGQLFRRYGAEGQQRILESLVFVFISHMHADHHIGIISVLTEWNKVSSKLITADSGKKIVLVGPSQIWVWLNEMSDFQDIGLSRITFIDSRLILWRPELAANEQLSMPLEFLNLTGLSSVNTVSVTHCPSAFAMFGQTVGGFKFAFSGDCRPSAEFAKAAYGTDFLLHEATLDDDMQAEAIQKRHCTIKEALTVAHNMQAKNVLLTHFSQRYPKLPNVDAGQFVTDNHGEHDLGGQSRPPVVGVAFDLMSVTMNGFWKLPVMVPALQTLFPKEQE
eukprot:jgi/Hompol1/3200/HPOL_003161-RA